MRAVSFFWYLYGVIALALIMTISSVFFVIQQVEQRQDVQDFARDIRDVYWQAYYQCGEPGDQPDCYRQQFRDAGFDLSREFSGPPHDALEVQQTPPFTLEIFRYQLGYQARHSDLPGWWLRDGAAHLQQTAQDDDQSYLMLVALLLTLALLLGIGLFLYWPVRRLMRWLDQLEQATDALAREDYDIRLAAIRVRPFQQLTQGFNRMVVQIRQNLEEKRLLANAMAHEMRTPLSRARLALALLQRQPDQADDSQALLQDLDRYLDELENVTNNSLQLVRLQHSDLQLQPLALDRLLLQKVRLRQSSSSPLNWRTELAPQPATASTIITTDERFLTLIIDNLLNNAEHYARQQVSVCLQHHQGALQLIISDDGPGIPAAQQQQALQAYSRLDNSRDRRSGGIGLGLALVNTACQRLNIHLSMADNLPGLRVTLTWPG